MPTPQEIIVRHGLCWCGCNRFAPLATMTNSKFLRVQGEPTRYIVGHGNRQRPVLEEATPFKIEEVYCRLIPLTQGLWAIVDESDYRWLMQWKWHAMRDARTGYYYAGRVEKGHGRKPRLISMHRFVLGLEHDDPRLGDHKNKCGIDCRRKNLRPADHEENARNAWRSKANTSGAKGVYRKKDRRKWGACIRHKGKLIHLGYFDRFEDAKAAYEKAALEYFGEFASFD